VTENGELLLDGGELVLLVGDGLCLEGKELLLLLVVDGALRGGETKDRLAFLFNSASDFSSPWPCASPQES